MVISYNNSDTSVSILYGYAIPVIIYCDDIMRCIIYDYYVLKSIDFSFFRWKEQ